VDTLADFTSFPIAKARRETIPFCESQQRTAIGLVGATTVYRDRIRVLIGGREHDWPCDFVNVPAHPEQGRPAWDLLPALGRAGFLDEYAITIDSGYLIVTRIGPIRRWLRQCLHHIWTFFGMVHPPERPL